MVADLNEIEILNALRAEILKGKSANELIKLGCPQQIVARFYMKFLRERGEVIS